MLRFLPDGWLEAVLRPFLLADPVAGLYVEIDASDWRFAALALLLAWAALGLRSARFLQYPQGAAIFGLAACFYLWTLASGNGRYFMWGLVMAGPLVVVLARKLPVTQAMRNTVILGVLAMQGLSLTTSFMPNMWGLRPWQHGPGLALEASLVRDSPAVFVTMGAISYSALVPQMHRDSRWTNVTGQRDILPGVLEYPALQRLLDSPLPKYLVVRATPLTIGPDGQPVPLARKSIAGSLARHDLAESSETCTYVQSLDSTEAIRRGSTKAINEGFWFCPIRPLATAERAPRSQPVAPEVDAVFVQVEQRCPRFFPPGSARSRQIDGGVLRYYSHSDTGLYVDNSGVVYFKNNRALNPTIIATIEQVRSGGFSMDCVRMPGRYLPPWERK